MNAAWGEEHVVCDLCGADAPLSLMLARDRLFGLPGAFRLVRCAACGLVYLCPRPTWERLLRYYPLQGYDPYRSPAARWGPAARWRRAWKRLALAALRGYPFPQGKEKARPRARWLRLVTILFLPWRTRLEAVPPYRARGRLLDVGCGSGTYLRAMRDLGWEVCGVEVNAEAARLARERWGLDVRQGTLEEAGLPGSEFDVITFWHTLEHLPSPRRALAECRRLLRPGGLIMLETPNCAGPGARLFGERWFHLDAPRHLYAFTPDTLRRLLAQLGFTAVQVWPVANALGLAGSLQLIWDEKRGRVGGRGWRENPLVRCGAWLVSQALLGLGAGDCLRAVAVRP
jgi:2-polyprenyl-3-methyl-5-hydroxy-6-metoxy-1,4-benzoquinol methylase